EIDRPQKKQAGRRRNPRKNEQRQDRSRAALPVQAAVVRTPPAKRRLKVIARQTQVLLAGGLAYFVHPLLRGNDAVLSYESRYLRPKRDERDEVNQTKRAQKRPADPPMRRPPETLTPE